jgi:hypothetical protein
MSLSRSIRSRSAREASWLICCATSAACGESNSHHRVPGRHHAVQLDITCHVTWGFINIATPTTGPNQPSIVWFDVDGVAKTGATPGTVGLGLPYIPPGRTPSGFLELRPTVLWRSPIHRISSCPWIAP